MKQTIRYCLFDMDGLLIDTERIYTEVSTEILARYGKIFTWELKSKMMGLRETDAAKLLIEETSIPLTPEGYLVERNRLQSLKFPSCQPLPGVEKLIKHLKKHKIPIAVATSSHTNAFKLKTQNHKALFDLFDVIVCGDDPEVKRGKPHPDLFLCAAQRLDSLFSSESGSTSMPTQHCLVFEDAIAGVEAGLAANMQVVWVPDTKLLEFFKGENKATITLSSLEAFQPEIFGLPPFDK